MNIDQTTQMNFRIVRLFALIISTLLSVEILFSQPIPSYQLLIENPRLIGTTYQFDVYVKRVGPTNFRMGNSQYILNFSAGSFTAPAITRVSASEQIGTGFFFDQVIAGSELRLSVGGNGSYSNSIDIDNIGNGTRVSTYRISGVNVPVLSAGLTWINAPSLIRTGVSEIDAADNYRDITDMSGSSHLNGGGEFGSISGYKFNDLNGNGTWDLPAEPPLNGWTINISGPAGPLSAVTGSGSWATGYYEFLNLPPGSYAISEVLQPGWSQTSSTPASLILAPGQQIANNNFGNYNGPAFRGTTFEDINNNGFIDLTESGIGGWQIVATKVVGGDIRTQVSAPNGSYVFTFVPAESGLWVISETPQPGWVQTYPVGPSTYTINVQSGSFQTGIDFANFHPSTISGTKFEDINGDSISTGGEPGISGWRIRLTKNSIQIDSTLTDALGHYTFGALNPGTYTVSEELPSGWIQTRPGSGGVLTSIISVGGTYVAGMDFGNFHLGTISGVSYYDTDHNGTRNGTEPGMTGLTITLNGPSGVSFATTGPGGTWAFQNLRAGSYLLSETPPSGYHIIQPPGGTYSRNIISGSAVGGIAFGNSATGDSAFYRSFTYDSLALARDAKGKIGKPMRLRPDRVQFCVSLRNQTGRTIDGMRITFSVPVFVNDPRHPFVITPTPRNLFFAQRNAVAELDWNAPIGVDSVVNICGWGIKPQYQILKVVWKSSGVVVARFYENVDPVRFQTDNLKWPLPNAANITTELFSTAGLGFPDPASLIVGVPRRDSAKYFGWVTMRKPSDVHQSFIDRFAMHRNNFRGFDRFDNGKAFNKERNKLPPRLQNNHIFANVATLKINISASERGITPFGFGELIYEDGTNPLSGLTLRQIALKADSALTFWRGVTVGSYHNFDSVLDKINIAFSGPMDTISFSSGLRIKGVRKLQDVSYLRANPNIVPGVIPEIEPPREAIPEEFSLMQNYPNPFNPSTTIQFELRTPSIVSLKIYNILGAEVVSLINQQMMEDGMQESEFDASGLASGVYFYRLVVQPIDEDEHALSPIILQRKMLLLK